MLNFSKFAIRIHWRSFTFQISLDINFWSLLLIFWVPKRKFWDSKNTIILFQFWASQVASHIYVIYTVVPYTCVMEQQNVPRLIIIFKSHCTYTFSNNNVYNMCTCIKWHAFISMYILIYSRQYVICNVYDKLHFIMHK